MEKKELMQLFKLYTDRYGEKSMGSETMKMWWNQLKDEDFIHVVEAFELLLGKHEFKFSFSRVKDVIESKHPKNLNTAEIDSWEKKVPVTDKEMQGQVSVFMRDIIADNERCVRTNRPVTEWLSRLVAKSTEVFGKEEMGRICRTMSNGRVSDMQSEFCGLVNRSLRS